MSMISDIQEKLQTVEGIRSLTRAQLYYAWQMIDTGLEIPYECSVALAEECTMNLDIDMSWSLSEMADNQALIDSDLIED